MTFQGEVRSVAALINAAHSAPDTAPGLSVGLRHTAKQNALACRRLLTEGESLDACWRFGILQTVDDYTSTLKRGGASLAELVFEDEPPQTGSAKVDAAFAALAEFLAERDGWQPPDWSHDPTRGTNVPWYPAVPAILRSEADRETPEAFGKRGIRITSRSLARA